MITSISSLLATSENMDIQHIICYYMYSMSEAFVSREFDPADLEADQTTIKLLEQYIQDAVSVYDRWYDPTIGGACSLDIDQDTGETLEIAYRMPGSNRPINDYCFMKEIPEATAHLLRFYGNHVESPDRLTGHREVEEVWVSLTPTGKKIRRRVYDPMYFNYSLEEEVPPEEYSRLAKLYDAKRQVYLEQVTETDKEEELLGLNRVSTRQVMELIKLITTIRS